MTVIRATEIDFGGPALQTVTQKWFAADADAIELILVDTREAPVPKQELERYSAALFRNTGALEWLKRERGIDSATAAEFRLGLDAGRLIIPVVDEFGHCRNLRKYRRDGKPKMLGMQHRSMRLFPWRAFLEHTDRPIIAVEGELDAIVGWQSGLRTLTAGGAMTLGPWRLNLKHLAGERIRIVFDNDDAGRAGAVRLAELLLPVAGEVKIVQMPLDGKGADLTDWILSGGQGSAA